MGCNNPVRYLVEEARREFGPTREVGCIVSIGTGKPKVAGFKAPSLLQRSLPLDLIEVLASMATDSEAEASAMKLRYQNCPGLYHPLNVKRGLEGISLEEWEKMGDVKAHTMAYLRERDISSDVNIIVDALVGRSSQTFTLSQLDGTVSNFNDTVSTLLYPSSRVNNFVMRTEPQEEMRKYLETPGATAMPNVVILLGMGGCRKSQLALDYCQESEKRKSYSGIFWIDAMSPITLEQSLTAVAQELSKPGFDVADIEGNIGLVLKKMRTWPGRWLFVFDNFDNITSFKKKSIKDYFPRSNKGSILITSRDTAAKYLGYDIDISTMSKEESRELLLKRSATTQSIVDDAEVDKIVERLGFHALAIDQAGAYIQARNLGLELFLEHYNKRREEVQNEIPGLWDYKRRVRPSTDSQTKLTVYTTWQLSFDLISGDQETRDAKEHILTLMAFFDRNAISDTLFRPYSSRHSSWMELCTTDNVWDEHKFQKILIELKRLSLVQNLVFRSQGLQFTCTPLFKIG